MSQISHETRSTIILFIAILIAVVVTVWIILSFDKPNYRNTEGGQTGSKLNIHKSYNVALLLEDNYT
jgi:hypothetical protein